MKDEQVDITGLMVKAKPGWEERVEKLCKGRKFLVTVQALPSLVMELTGDELQRLEWKLKLVKEFATYMAAGMLKGTIKYKHDTYSLDQWMAHLIGEGADQANYSLLLFNAFLAEKDKDDPAQPHLNEP